MMPLFSLHLLLLWYAIFKILNQILEGVSQPKRHQNLARFIGVSYLGSHFLQIK